MDKHIDELLSKLEKDLRIMIDYCQQRDLKLEVSISEVDARLKFLNFKISTEDKKDSIGFRVMTNWVADPYLDSLKDYGDY